MSKIKSIPPEITEIISFLAYSFAKSMRSAIYEKDDLQQDLIVIYLEKYKPYIPKNHWFIIFKNHLLNKYKRIITERKVYETIKKEIHKHPCSTKEITY
jgi:hypothetical protein